MNKYITVKSKSSLSELYDKIKEYEAEDSDKTVYIENSKNNRYKIIMSEDVFGRTSIIFAEFLICGYVSLLVDELLREHCSPYFFDETDLIKNTFSSIIVNGKNKSLTNSVKREIELIVNQHSEINIRGYFVFSMPKYYDKIIDMLRSAILDIKKEEEYDNFVAGLICYFENNNRLSGTFSVIEVENGVYMYVNEVNNDCTDEFEMSSSGYFDNSDYYPTVEDEILDVLIDKRPEKIIFHLKSNGMNLNFIYTMEAIFGDRFKICTNGCEICKK